MKMVMGKFMITAIVSVIGGQLKQYVVFTGHINLCLDGSDTHLDGSGTFVRGSGRSWKCPECPETVLVCPGSF